MRGNHDRLRAGGPRPGSIPARAGEPASSHTRCASRAVYPRACGGTLGHVDSLLLVLGLSPRVRGNRGGPVRPHLELGSIPARAGEPSGRCKRFKHKGGLSPRVRGNPFRPARTRVSDGSIPARAGEPRGEKNENRPHEVYPRACGGTGVRGGLNAPPGVYPRACGGTLAVCRPTGGVLGLSPRVRGNRGFRHATRAPPRSIPARAGEPPSRRTGGSRGRVYPRACGGTVVAGIIGRIPGGLSPRVRGNHPQSIVRRRCHGSIPARAGEPSTGGSARHQAQVYPRACGGTAPFAAGLHRGPGLSPRVRGNQIARAERSVDPRSIPARAGEPPAHSIRRGDVGSIPARAGEPA